MGMYLTRAKSELGKKVWIFPPEIVRSGCHKLMQYNRVWRLGLSYRESAKMEYFPLILVGGFPDAFPDVTDDQSGRSGGHGFFCTAGEGVTPRSYTI